MIFNFSIYKYQCRKEMIWLSFNLDENSGTMPDHFEDEDEDAIYKLFKSIGLEAIEDMEDCYPVELDDVQSVGDALMKAGLKPVVNKFGGNENKNLYPLPDGSIPN
jgi:hypothetical protein